MNPGTNEACSPRLAPSYGGRHQRASWGFPFSGIPSEGNVGVGLPPWPENSWSDVSEASRSTLYAPSVVVSSPPKSQSSSRLRSSALGATIVVAAHRRG